MSYSNEFNVQRMLLEQLGNRKRYIASVHFMDMIHKGLRHIGKAGYVLPAPTEKGKVSVITVTDAAQLGLVADDIESPPYQGPKIVAVEGIVSDLLKAWCGQLTGMMKGHRPGIGEIKSPEPTEQERKRLYDWEFDFCVTAVAEGDVFHSQPFIPGQGKRIIQPFHRLAHEWLRQNDGSFKQRVWATAATIELTKRGAASGTQIPLHARFDAGVDLLKFYRDNNENPLNYGDTYLYAKLEAERAAEAKPQPAKR
jgi:hypothetical protein